MASYSRTDGLRAGRLGRRHAPAPLHDPCGFALPPSLIGAVVGLARGRRQAVESPARGGRAGESTRPCCAACPTFWSSTSSISAAARSCPPRPGLRGRGLLGHALLSGRRARGRASSRPPTRRRSTAAPASRYRKGQIEAAKAVGMGRAAAFPPGRRAPGAALRPARARQRVAAGAQGIGAVSVTGLVELLRMSQIGAGSTRQPFAFYLAAGALYLVLTTDSSTAVSSAGRGRARRDKHAADVDGDRAWTSPSWPTSRGPARRPAAHAGTVRRLGR